MIKEQNWWQLTSIQIGGAICLPTIMIGQALNQTYGFNGALIAIILGNIILLLAGLITAKMSYEERKNTVENALNYFGSKGVLLFTLTMLLSLLGWFAIQLNMMSLSVLDLLSIDSTNILFPILLNIALGTLFTLVALYGIRGINFLANLSLPLLLLTLGYAAFTVDKKIDVSQPPISLAGVSLVIAIAVAVVIDLPTYFRHARSSKDGFISIIILFGLTIPLLEFIGVYLASGTSGGTILDVLKRHNGSLWNIWVSLFIILAGWTTNNLNLYSGIVCLENLSKKISEQKYTLLFGGAGTFLSCFDLLSHFEVVLDAMGILIASVGSVITTRYLINQFKGPIIVFKDFRRHVFAALIGIFLGILGMLGISMTSIALLDASIGASLGTLLILIPKKKPNEEALSR